jgi:hypothetical protein
MRFSAAIDDAIEKALADGNEIAEVSTGWTKVREAIDMKRPLSKELRARLERDKRLRPWSIEATPHNKAEEGFTDDQAKILISFPR